MTSDFDKNTEKLAEEYDTRFGEERDHFKAGRLSTKESLAIAIRALEKIRGITTGYSYASSSAVEKIIAKELSAIRSRGDYTNEEQSAQLSTQAEGEK